MAAQAAAAETLGRVAVAGGALVAAAYYSLFNVEGGKRAIVFNRVVGVKNEVRAAPSAPSVDPSPSHRQRRTRPQVAGSLWCRQDVVASPISRL